MRAKNYFNKKNLSTLIGLTVFTIGSMVYYRSAKDELAEAYRESFLPWLLPTALLAGLNEALEVYDHITLTPQITSPERHIENALLMYSR